MIRIGWPLLLVAATAVAEEPADFVQRTLAGTAECHSVVDDDDALRAAAAASPAIALAEAGAVEPLPAFVLPVEIVLDARDQALAPDSATLLAQAASAIRQALAADPQLMVELVAQTAAPGGTVAAQARASLVRAYLMARGVAFSRLRVAVEPGASRKVRILTPARAGAAPPAP